MNNNNEGENIFGEVIHSYTRAQAIEDGMLIDVSEMAKEAGFRMSVAVTARVWAQCIEVPAKVQAQDEMGRLWDVVSRVTLPSFGSPIVPPSRSLQR